MPLSPVDRAQLGLITARRHNGAKMEYIEGQGAYCALKTTRWVLRLRPRDEVDARLEKDVWGDVQRCDPNVTRSVGWCMSPRLTITGVPWSRSFMGRQSYDHVASTHRHCHREEDYEEQHTL
jgi:hypothetical protein